MAYKILNIYLASMKYAVVSLQYLSIVCDVYLCRASRGVIRSWAGRVASRGKTGLILRKHQCAMFAFYFTSRARTTDSFPIGDHSNVLTLTWKIYPIMFFKTVTTHDRPTKTPAV